jgi:hypothetical protein
MADKYDFSIKKYISWVIHFFQSDATLILWGTPGCQVNGVVIISGNTTGSRGNFGPYAR